MSKKIPNLISGGVLYSKKKLDKRLFKPKYRPNVLDYVKIFLKINLSWLKKIKFYYSNNDYLNPYQRFDSNIVDGLIDNYSYRKIIKTNILKLNANLIKNYKIQCNFLKKIPLQFKLLKIKMFMEISYND